MLFPCHFSLFKLLGKLSVSIFAQQEEVNFYLKALKWFIERYLNWFYQQRRGGDGRKASVAAGLWGSDCALGSKASSSGSQCIQGRVASVTLHCWTLDRRFLAFAEFVLSSLKCICMSEYRQLYTPIACLSSTKTTWSLEAIESFKVILRLPLHLQSLILVGDNRACFHLVVRDEEWGAQSMQ